MYPVVSVLMFRPLKHFRKGTDRFTNVPDVVFEYVNILPIATPYSSHAGQNLLQ